MRGDRPSNVPRSEPTRGFASREASEAAAAGATVRQRMAELLREGPATAKDLSKLLGISEREVSGHLAHLAKSLRARGEPLVMTPPACLACGFAFPGRERTTRPSHCPRCRSRRISLPEFRVG